MEVSELRERFASWCSKNDFQLNPDSKHADTAMEGVLKNEEKKGFKFCPCRLGKEGFDAELLCPCNFKAQDTWKEKGQCWCGLFVRKG